MTMVAQERHQNTHFHSFPYPVAPSTPLLISCPSSEGSELPPLPCHSQPRPWSYFSESTPSSPPLPRTIYAETRI